MPEVAEATGLAAWRIYELVAVGQIPHLRVGRTLRSSERALAEWIENGGPSSMREEDGGVA